MAGVDERQRQLLQCLVCAAAAAGGFYAAVGMVRENAPTRPPSRAPLLSFRRPPTRQRPRAGNRTQYLPPLARPNVTQFESEGYVIIDDVFDAAEIDEMRARVQQLKPQATQFGPSKALKLVDPGMTIPDFVRRPEFSFMHGLPSHPRIMRSLHHVFREKPFRYCSHNDIGINRIVAWHKDKLNDQYTHYQKLPLWPEHPIDGGHLIVKVLIYLQDHVADDHSLLLVPGSFSTPSYETAATRRLHPRKGSIVIFEQRTTHRGLSISQGMAHHLQHAADDRLLVSLGYGLSNAYTAEFEAGTKARQADQCGAKCSIKPR